VRSTRAAEAVAELGSLGHQHTAMLIHIKRNDEIFGPYSVEEARSYLLSGRLSLSDFAQMEGTSEWIPLSSVPGLKSAPPPPALPSLVVSPPPSSQPTPDSPVHFGYVIRDVIIVDSLKLSAAKTKEFAGVVKNLGLEGTSLFVVDAADTNARLASRNIPTVAMTTGRDVNTYELLKFDKLVFTKAGFEQVEQRLAK